MIQLLIHVVVEIVLETILTAIVGLCKAITAAGVVVVRRFREGLH